MILVFQEIWRNTAVRVILIALTLLVLSLSFYKAGPGLLRFFDRMFDGPDWSDPGSWSGKAYGFSANREASDRYLNRYLEGLSEELFDIYHVDPEDFPGNTSNSWRERLSVSARNLTGKLSDDMQRYCLPATSGNTVRERYDREESLKKLNLRADATASGNPYKYAIPQDAYTKVLRALRDLREDFLIPALEKYPANSTALDALRYSVSVTCDSADLSIFLQRAADFLEFDTEKRLYESGRYTSSEDLYNTYQEDLKINPDYGRLLAEIYRSVRSSDGDYQLQLRLVRSSFQMNPSDDLARDLTDLLLIDCRYSGADICEANFQESLTSIPSSLTGEPGVMLQLAELSLLSGDRRRTEAFLNRLEMTFPDLSTDLQKKLFRLRLANAT